MKEEEMMEIADLIHASLEVRTDPAKLAAIRQEVIRFTSRFPLP
jgi:glycine/serine hydroxymethyltransferase